MQHIADTLIADSAVAAIGPVEGDSRRSDPGCKGPDQFSIAGAQFGDGAVTGIRDPQIRAVEGDHLRPKTDIRGS